MEKDFEYETTSMKQEQLEPKSKIIELESEKELEDIVYIFTSSKDIGIKFYDRTPEPGSQVAKLIGTPPKGKYITDLSSISVEKWDDEMNIANGTKMVRYMDGSVKVTTIIVSEEKMLEILEKIDKSKDPDRIIIDTRSIGLYDERMKNIAQKETPNSYYKKEDLSSFTDFDTIFNSNVINSDSINNNIAPNTKGLK